ncbi:hypothetical protein FH972_025768 [Carpinus fangiana]|uniref:Uncharacterized protein n=1 Tax=Carpinus fangiana TaxID=176857 RepID=A0A5N6L1Y9_9ROSI|nr:hypothetical protein FH972_025768 [Carpinus fangiana]
MDSTIFHSPNSDFSSESSFGSPESFSWDGLKFDHQSFLPFNENDSEEMLLLGLISKANQETTWESPGIAEGHELRLRRWVFAGGGSQEKALDEKEKYNKQEKQ